jgi:hypothetical protein
MPKGAKIGVKYMSEEIFEVRVGKLPGRIDTIALNGDHTVSAALAAAGLTVPAGFEVRVDGDPVSVGSEVEEGSTILVVKQSIKGN